MEDFVERSLLFDFYGELLTERQRKIYSAIVFEDYSVSEIAREEGISRQGVHDLRKRCDHILEEYEERLHLVERFVHIRERIQEIRRLTAVGEQKNEGLSAAAETEKPVPRSDLRDSLRTIDRIALSILEEL